MSNFIVGLTGGIGSGKSTISRIFKTFGVVVIDADICARIVVESGKPALTKISEHFGADILNSDGTLNRAKLRNVIFNNDQERIWLETLLHPLIQEEIRHQLTHANSTYVILESPLLIETTQKKICHRILVVDVDEEVQIQRTMSRDNHSREQVQAIMRNQASRSDRIQAADDIINNSSTSLDALNQQVTTLHKQYLQLASAI